MNKFDKVTERIILKEVCNGLKELCDELIINSNDEKSKVAFQKRRNIFESIENKLKQELTK